MNIMPVTPDIKAEEAAPREEMKEKNFRKWEQLIGAACKGSVMIDPAELIPSLKPASVLVGVRGAIRGHKMFHYKTEVIPVGYDLGRIKVKQRRDGRVMLCNDYEDSQAKRKAEAAKVEDLTLVLLHQDGSIARVNQKDPILEHHKCFWPADRDKIIVLMRRMVTEPYEKWGATMLFIVKVEKQAQVTELRALAESQSDPLDIDRYDHGWWRVVRTPDYFKATNL